MYKNNARLDSLYLDAFHETQEICNQTLSKHDIHFFDYARMFDDGSCYIVSNHEDVINYLFDTAAPMFTPVPPANIKEKFYYFIPEEGPYQKTIHHARTHFNLANVIDLFEVHDGYVDICCFGGAADNDGMLNYYLNHLDDLNSFCARFKEQAQDMLIKLNANRIRLPREMQLNFDSKAVMRKSAESVLSKRQSECISLLCEGKTMKEIAALLRLSPRTVEHYIEYAKNKLDCGSRAELIIKYKKI